MTSELTAKYLSHLEELLSQVKVAANLKPNSDLGSDNFNYNAIDNYIAELNNYYYQSFHNHFFPYYSQTITQEVAELWQIKQEQDIIIQDLATNLKRYAKLYNQVKIVAKLLANTREDFNNSLYTVYREKEAPNTELLYVLKGLHNTLLSLQNLINLLITLYEDKPLLEAVKLYPNMPKVLIKTYKKAPRELDMVKRLIVRLRAILQLVKQLQAKQISPKIVAAILTELKLQAKAISSDKSWSALPKPFIADFNHEVKSFTELISAYSELRKIDKIPPLAQVYENRLASFILILDKGLDFLAKDYSRLGEDLFSFIFTINDLSHHNLLNLKHTIDEIKTALDKILDIINLTGEPDFVYLAKIATTLLDDYRDNLHQLGEDDDFRQVPPLAKPLNSLNLEFSLLDRELQLLKEKYALAQLLEVKYLGLINVLDSYLSFISNTRGDLERMLAPRNLSRAWKGVKVRVDRIPLEVGKTLPLDNADLLAAISREIPLNPSQTHTIASEAGDIFIITINNNTVYEIPVFTWV